MELILYFKNLVNEVVIAIGYFIQRIFRGWDDRDTENLEVAFCKWLEPRLKRYREISLYHPSHIYSAKEWNETLNDFLIDLDRLKNITDKDELAWSRHDIVRRFADLSEHLIR